MAVKLAASMAVCLSAIRHNSELPAKASMAVETRSTRRSRDMGLSKEGGEAQRPDSLHHALAGAMVCVRCGACIASKSAMIDDSRLARGAYDL